MHKRIDPINYDYIEEYSIKDIKIYKDSEKGLSYVLVDGKKLYYPRGYSKGKIALTHIALLREQDIRSPHYYFFNSFFPNKDSVVLDIGAAEGLISLQLVEKVRHIYLFECDEKWLEALDATFAPWKERVTIINKLVSDKSDNTSLSIDDFIATKEKENGYNKFFIKCDIEGYELSFLQGAIKTMNNEKIELMMAIASYHGNGAYQDIVNFLKKYGFETVAVPGKVAWLDDESNWREVSDIFRTGIVQARKRVKEVI